MKSNEIEYLKIMKVDVPDEWKSDKYVLVDEYKGWPWDNNREPKDLEPGETLKKVIKLLDSGKVPVVILSETITHKRTSQTLRHHEVKLLLNISRQCFIFLEKRAGFLERLEQ